MVEVLDKIKNARSQQEIIGIVDGFSRESEDKKAHLDQVIYSCNSILKSLLIQIQYLQSEITITDSEYSQLEPLLRKADEILTSIFQIEREELEKKDQELLENIDKW